MSTTTKQSPAQPTAQERKAMEQAAKKREAEQRKLAERIAKMRADGMKWDGEGGVIAEGIGIKSATQGRALLRRYNLVDKAGGIQASYTRFRDGRERKPAKSK